METKPNTRFSRRLLGVLIVAASVLLYSGRASSKYEIQFEKRTRQIKHEARRLSPGDVFFIGDSITENASLPEMICNRPVVNAGLAGFDVARYEAFLSEMSEFKAFAIVIALGTNDATKSHTPDFLLQYSRLLTLAAAHSENLILVGLPPIEPGWLSEFFNRDRLTDVNLMIKHVSIERGYPFVDLMKVMTSNNLTKDGVHLNESGYRYWLRAIVGDVQTALYCQGF